MRLVLITDKYGLTWLALDDMIERDLTIIKLVGNGVDNH